MASGLSASLSGGSEEGFDTYCSPCFDNGISKEAEKYCMECCVIYCEPCLKTHNKIPLCKGHHVLDKSGQGVRTARTSLPTDQCIIHKGKLEDMFCADHDTVCCGACIAINHRLCMKVDYLPDVAKGIKTSQEYREINECLDEMLNKLNNEKIKRQENLSSLKKEKSKADKEITMVEEELKKKITELAQQARTELLAKYYEGRKAIECDISIVECVITKVTSGKDKLKSGNEAHLFLNVKAGKMITKDGQTLLSALLKTGKKKCMKFVPNKDLQQLPQQLNLGSICFNDEGNEDGSAEVREYTAKLQGRTGSQEVAVALYNKKKIQFVSVAGTMTLTRSFRTDHTCHSVAFNDVTGELFVSNDSDQVKVYNKKGQMSQSYVYDDKGIPLFKNSGRIALSADKNTFYITDWINGLKAVDQSSSLRWTFCDQDLHSACGICVLPDDAILVSGFESNNVIQIDKHGKKVGIILAADDNLNQPNALAYHHNTSRLIVGHRSNEIYVFTLSPK